MDSRSIGLALTLDRRRPIAFNGQKAQNQTENHRADDVSSSHVAHLLWMPEALRDGPSLSRRRPRVSDRRHIKIRIEAVPQMRVDRFWRRRTGGGGRRGVGRRTGGERNTLKIGFPLKLSRTGLNRLRSNSDIAGVRLWMSRYIALRCHCQANPKCCILDVEIRRQLSHIKMYRRNKKSQPICWRPAPFMHRSDRHRCRRTHRWCS